MSIQRPRCGPAPRLVSRRMPRRMSWYGPFITWLGRAPDFPVVATPANTTAGALQVDAGWGTSSGASARRSIVGDGTDSRIMWMNPAGGLSFSAGIQPMHLPGMLRTAAVAVDLRRRL